MVDGLKPSPVSRLPFYIDQGVMNMKNKKNLLLFLVYFAFFSGACGRKKQDETTSAEVQIPVSAVEAAPGTVYRKISLVGDVRGHKEATVYARVSGRLIRKIKTEGDFVKEDETVAVITRDEAAMDFADAEVKSPINGVVTKYFVGIGESVFPMQSAVFQVANTDKLNIEVHVSERDLPSVKRNQSAKISVDVFPKREFWGRVAEVEPAINPVTRKSKVIVELDNENGVVRPGMFAVVEIITDVHTGIVVPASAVVERDGRQAVFVVDEENKARMLHVKTGLEDEKKVIIRDGLKKDQSVIYEGNYALIDGVRVEIK